MTLTTKGQKAKLSWKTERMRKVSFKSLLDTREENLGKIYSDKKNSWEHSFIVWLELAV